MEMKNFITLVVFSTIALLFAFRYPGSTKLEWMEWDEAYAEAKATKKIILIDAYTDWCGWCKKMDADTYSKAEIIKLINKDFIPVKFNPELKNKKYRVGDSELTGPELLANLAGGQRIGYPTTFFLSIEKNQVQMESGYKNPESLKAILSEKVEWAKSK